MFRPRVIPVLLLKKDCLVKSVRFKNHRYIGDPINAVRNFNELLADELIILDIDASREKKVINVEILRQIGEEAQMPFCVGGGVNHLAHIEQLITAGAERVVIGTQAVSRPNFIEEAAKEFGSSTICVCMDVKKNFFGKPTVYTLNGKQPSSYHPVSFAKLMENQGAGEIIIQSIDQDGCMNGYDLELIKEVSKQITIPAVALGGAGGITDMVKASAYVSGLAAGSAFVFYKKTKGVLINYPKKQELTFYYGE